jgi:transcriptional regulator with XRE-family HTH domain
MSSKTSRCKSVEIDWKAVGRRIRELRGFDTSQAEFAQRVGITQAYLSMIEHGKRELGGTILLKISCEFRRSIEWLLTGEE